MCSFVSCLDMLIAAYYFSYYFCFLLFRFIYFGIFVLPLNYGQWRLLCFHCILMSDASITIFCFTRILNGFWRNLGKVITITNRLTNYILMKLHHGQGNRIWQKIWIYVKPVLPCSEWLHIFHSTYGTLHPQGWRVHYTHAAVEASYDRVRFLAL